MLTFGLPPDPVAWLALVLALVLALSVFLRREPNFSQTRSLPLLLALAASLLSAGYFQFYLGGAPRLIDATTYLLEAHTFSDGSFSFEVPAPSGNFRGRFLITPSGEPDRLAPIFPPGYPALLALGIHLGTYKIIGPLLGAGLVLLTFGLAFELTRDRNVALVASILSTLSACLRYHTAETMSHGWAALLAATAVWATIALQRKKSSRRWLGLLGGSLGLLIATRQLTGLVFTLGCFSVLGTIHLRRRQLSISKSLSTIAAMTPGVGILLAHQKSVTGDLFTSAQSRYYALADGPLGCFGVGLGKGCGYEHAEVVLEQGGQGLTAGWALLNTAHRFHWHLLDVANFEPLVLVGVLFAYGFRRESRLLAIVVPFALIPAAYGLFYFSGSYPGGGARFFSELIPLWHVLIAGGLVQTGTSRLGVALSLFGFSVHGAFSHLALSREHFGPPAEKLKTLSRQIGTAETNGADEKESPELKPIVLFSSAHYFNIAYTDSRYFTAARNTRDDRIHVLWDALGRPPIYSYSLSQNGDPLLQKIVPNPPFERTLLYEAEYEYPSSSQDDLWVHPEYLPDSCVSAGRALALRDKGQFPSLSFFLFAPAGRYEIHSSIRVSENSCERVSLGSHQLPGVLKLPRSLLFRASHIDRISLTKTHH